MEVYQLEGSLVKQLMVGIGIGLLVPALCLAQVKPTPEQITQSAFSHAQRCMEQSILMEAQIRAELQAQIDALKKQLAEKAAPVEENK